jgi:GNAT superfamily N-acetyltransferase
VVFTVAAAAPCHLDDLCALLGQRPFFADCLDAQARGRGVLLVGRLDGAAVGDVWVAFSPVAEAPVNEYLPGVPMLVHLEVVSVLRNRGYGTSLIRAAEGIVRSRGHSRVALGVGVTNSGARRLYERLGYAEWAHGTIATGYSWDGRWFPETITVLVKSLFTAGSGNPSPVR